MIHVRHASRGTARPDRPQAFRPSLDGLEDRILLYSTMGGGWSYPVRVTYSIVADGTSIGGTPSNLQQKLSSYSNWQQQIQKAASVWESVAGINLLQVPDDGSPIGSSGYQQGDPYSGDIRIGGMTQPGNQLAFAYAPRPFNNGAVAGDIFFNTDQWWQTNATTYDVMTVAIHEFGHALGMGHSDIDSAVMYAGYNSAKQSSTSDDTQGARSIYGSRQPDRFDASASNNSLSYATRITPYFDGSGQISLPDLDISSGGDVDWYKFTVPANGSMTIRMQSSRLSSLLPRFTVYNESLQSVGTVTGASYGDTITVTVPNVEPNQTWYIKAMAGATGPAGIGAYGLQVNVGSDPQAALAPPYTYVAAQPDQDPTTSSMGTGWYIGGEFIPYLGILDLDRKELLGGLAGLGIVNGLYKITYGTLTGYGNAEIVDASAPPIQAPGHGETRHAGARAALSPGAQFGDPSGPSPSIAADERGGLWSNYSHGSGRRGQVRAARVQAVDAARARMHHRRLVIADLAVRSPSSFRVDSLSRIT